MASVRRFLRAVFITGPPKPNGAYRNQGFSRATELFSEVKAEHPPGLLAKGVRFFILYANYVRPQVWLDTVFDWIWYAVGKGRRENEIATWRDLYYLARLIFFILGLFYWRGSAMIVWLIAIFVGDMLLQLGGDVLVWPRYAFSPQRSLLISLMNYAEVTTAFAVFYVHCDCVGRAPSPVQAAYLSAVVATTLGYLPHGTAEPTSSRGLLLVIGQLAVSVLFVLLFVSAFLSRAVGEPAEARNRPTELPNKALQPAAHPEERAAAER